VAANLLGIAAGLLLAWWHRSGQAFSNGYANLDPTLLARVATAVTTFRGPTVSPSITTNEFQLQNVIKPGEGLITERVPDAEYEFGQRESMRHRLRAYLPVMVLALVRDDRI